MIAKRGACVEETSAGIEAQSAAGLRRCRQPDVVSLHGGVTLAITLDVESWAEEQFGQCDLKDRRRTRRLVQLAGRVLSHPSGSLPEQTGDMGDLKAAYRLFACGDVKFEDIAEPHWEQTRRRSPGTYLVIDDTTELDFGIHRQIRGMGRTGNGGGWGFLLHSALIVGAEDAAIYGLAGQKIRYRKPTPKKENTAQRLQRDRESQLWGQVIDLVGAPPEGVRWIHVMDRGADNFEVYQHCRQQHCDWVVRVTQKARNMIVPGGGIVALQEHLKAIPLAGTYQLRLRLAPPHGSGGTSRRVRRNWRCVLGRWRCRFRRIEAPI